MHIFTLELTNLVSHMVLNEDFYNFRNFVYIIVLYTAEKAFVLEASGNHLLIDTAMYCSQSICLN